MLTNSFNITPEQFGNLIPVQPYRLILHSHIKSQGIIRLI